MRALGDANRRTQRCERLGVSQLILREAECMECCGLRFGLARASCGFDDRRRSRCRLARRGLDERIRGLGRGEQGVRCFVQCGKLDARRLQLAESRLASYELADKYPNG